jgi:hypothetical protein
LALDGSAHAPKNTAEDDSGEMDFTPKFKAQEAAPVSTATAPAQAAAESPLESRFADSNNDDETLDFFKNLANDD